MCGLLILLDDAGHLLFSILPYILAFLKGAENVDPRIRWMRMSTAQALIDIYAALVDVARRITRNPYR